MDDIPPSVIAWIEEEMNRQPIVKFIAQCREMHVVDLQTFDRLMVFGKLIGAIQRPDTSALDPGDIARMDEIVAQRMADES